MTNSTEDRIAARRQAEADLTARLAAVNLEGPHRFPEGGMFGGVGAMLGGGRDKFAVCTLCGAMVLLNDFTQEAPTVERSASLHAQWHADHA